MSDLYQEIIKYPHWQVIVRPAEFLENSKSRKECRELVRDCQVRFRGWYYPHIDKKMYAGKDYIQSDTVAKSLGHIETWRFYTSCQFAHYFSFTEDLRIGDEERQEFLSDLMDDSISENTSLLSILNALYLITEIFEFGSRLIQRGAIDKRIVLEIMLKNVKGRTLFFWDRMRTLFGAYTAQIDDVEAPIINLGVDEFLTKYKELALDNSVEVFEQFNWPDVSREVLKKDQGKFMQQRL